MSDSAETVAQQAAFEIYQRIFYDLKLVTGEWEADGTAIANEIATFAAQQVAQARREAWEAAIGELEIYRDSYRGRGYKPLVINRCIAKLRRRAQETP